MKAPSSFSFFVLFGSCTGTVAVVGLMVDAKHHVTAVAQNQQVGGALEVLIM